MSASANLALALALTLLLACAVACPAAAADWRRLDAGTAIPTPGMKYVDQPYVCRAADGRWLCLMTVGTLGETVKGSVNYAALTTSKDRGKTWTPFARCGRSYSVPLLTDGGRLFTWSPRSFAWSDDLGATWSEPVELPENSALITARPGQGGWSVAMPLVVGDEAWFSWAFVGRSRPPRDTEVYCSVATGLLGDGDPAAATWRNVPGKAPGLRGPQWDEGERHISEEPHLVRLTDGTLYAVWRTDRGHIGHATSKDGKSFGEPVALRDATGRVIKHPLACPTLWNCGEGRYLLWHHFHDRTPRGDNPYDHRNPAWVSGGVERDGTIAWSQPEILLYSDDLDYHSGRISYPGLLQDDGHYYLFETQKTVARWHEAPASFLEALWGQHGLEEVAGEGLRVDLAGEGLTGEVVVPELSDLAAGGGLTVGTWLEVPADAAGTVLDSRDDTGAGIALAFGERRTLTLTIGDGKRTATWSTDAGLLTPGRHHVAFIVDGGPSIIMAVVDGVLCDGGKERAWGWTRYGRIDRKKHRIDGKLRTPGGATVARVGPALRRLRIYDRALMVTEAVGNFRAGANAD